MRNEILVVDPHISKDAWVESYISLQPFIHFLEERIATDTGMKVHFFNYVLEKIAAYPELRSNVDIKEMHRYSEIFELVAAILFPISQDENTALWAIGNAFTPEIFFGSDAVYKLLSPSSATYGADEFVTLEESASYQKEMLYQSILQKLYCYQADVYKEWIHSFIDPATGLYQYYRLNIDKRFTTLTYRGNQPPLQPTEVIACMNHTNGFQQLEKRLPLSELISTGFTVFTLTNVTSQHAAEQLDKVLVKLTDSNASYYFDYINLLLKTILGNQHVEFGFMPIFTINNRTALFYENFPFSIIIKTCVAQGVAKTVFNEFIRTYLKEPGNRIYSPANDTVDLPPAIEAAFAASAIRLYTCGPVYNKEQLVGIFEMSTSSNEQLTEQFLWNSMLPVMPAITRLMQLSNDKVTLSIDTIIKDKFTSIQPSVQWRFNEAAWHYFRSNTIENKRLPVEQIIFNRVYPLYGAIDIKDSTIERNKALRKDLLVQLPALQLLLKDIETVVGDGNDNLQKACSFWLSQLSDFITIEQEMRLNDFLQSDIRRYLAKYEYETAGSLSAKISQYRHAENESEGIAYQERRMLESSIKMINNAVGQYFDLLKEELQTVYPCYFEKIRTDGIEYDIYIGQSIAPKQPFTMNHLHKIRLLQLESMAALTRLTNYLLKQLQQPLLTTQLIFIHSRPIDISFRNDERRFDVEGAYNIRYHIIKKRIDKVHLLNSMERLTQPGKIAMVYYNEQDLKEYISYIKQLQKSDVLLNDLEHLELEELQGVTGLRALRVGVNIGPA